MKILHLINTLEAGGAERLVAGLAPLQAAAGHSVTVAASSGRGSVFGAPLESDGVDVVYLSREGSPRNPGLVAKMAALFDQLKPDIVHVHLFPAQYFAALASRFARHKPILVTTEHSIGNRRIGRPSWRLIERAVYSRYRAIAAVGEDVALVYAEWTGLGARIGTIPNGINVSAFSRQTDRDRREDTRKSLGFDATDRVIGWVGRMAAPKRPADLVKALSGLPKGVCAVIVGDGPLRNETEALAASLGLTKRLRFLGERKDIPELLASFDAFVLSSDYEGFGLAAVEAMAAGLPVFLADIPPLRSIAGEAGRYFPPGDDRALAATLRAAAADPESEAARVAIGRTRAAGMDIKNCAAAYLDLYENLLRRR